MIKIINELSELNEAALNFHMKVIAIAASLRVEVNRSVIQQYFTKQLEDAANEFSKEFWKGE